MHFSNHVDTVNGPPLPSPNNVGMKKLFYDRVKCTAVHKLQRCLGGGGGGWGKRGGIKADHVNCPKSFVPHCRLKMDIRVTDVLTTCVEVIFRVT